MQKKIIGFYYHANHFANNMIPVIEYVKMSKNVFYVLNFNDNGIENKYDFLKEHMVNYYSDKKYLYIKRLKIVPIFGVLLYFIGLYIWLKHSIQKLNLSSIILSDDRTILSCLVLKVCKKLKIKTILYPVEAFQSKRERINEKIQHNKTYENNKFYSVLTNFFPGNYETLNTKIVYWYKPSIAIFGRLLNILSKNPWIRGGNNPDVVAVQSVKQFNENFKHNISHGKQILTGFPPHDYLFKNPIDDKIENAKKISNQKKIALIVGTTYYQIDKGNDLNHLHIENKKVVKIIVDELHPEYKILFKLHPRENLKQHKDILGNELFGQIEFVDPLSNIYELIKISDFILIYISSTVIGSLSKDCPIVAFNIGNARHFESFYSNFQSIKLAHDLDELKKIVNNYNKNFTLINEDHKKRLKDRKLFGCFDGKNTERFIKLIESF